jgi:hypothetical protein
MTNTLAYYAAATITAPKSFTVQATRVMFTDDNFSYKMNTFVSENTDSKNKSISRKFNRTRWPSG